MNNVVRNAEKFAIAARRYCSTVDSTTNRKRAELLLEIYRILPVLIGEAMALPNVELRNNEGESEQPSHRVSHEAWATLYESLKQKLDDWNAYKQVFDPTSLDTEPIFGSLADDIADIYRDLQAGLQLGDKGQVCGDDAVFHWRLMFYSHWGKHAINALEVIHCRVSELLM